VEDDAVEARFALRHEAIEDAGAPTGATKLFTQLFAFFRRGALVAVEEDAEESRDGEREGCEGRDAFAHARARLECPIARLFTHGPVDRAGDAGGADDDCDAVQDLGGDAGRGAGEESAGGVRAAGERCGDERPPPHGVVGAIVASPLAESGFRAGGEEEAGGEPVERVEGDVVVAVEIVVGLGIPALRRGSVSHGFSYRARKM
jgi:hypothetical protein